MLWAKDRSPASDTEDFGPFSFQQFGGGNCANQRLSPTQHSRPLHVVYHRPDHSASAHSRGWGGWEVGGVRGVGVGYCQVKWEAAKAERSPFPFSPAAITVVLWWTRFRKKTGDRGLRSPSRHYISTKPYLRGASENERTTAVQAGFLNLNTRKQGIYLRESFSSLFFLFVVLGIEPRALFVWIKHSATGYILSPQTKIIINNYI